MRDPKGFAGRTASDARGAEPGAGKPRGLDVRFASGADAAVGRRLKEMYDGLVSEPVPDRFLDLLNQLDNVEKPAKTASAQDGAAPSGAPVHPGPDGGLPGEKP
ncbi:NepR family anti-sigma factor [Pseudoxanthobacter sp. M-2]|uniref:NepR family anti-sigma factor n=1 Tax=Pseudoxanthobacter sp. M-2 TaxID=3078754 RepID=UPI0038FCCD79